MNIKSQLRMTASELAVGRFMRAPDHDASTGGGEGGGETGAPSGGGESASEEKLSSEQQLEREFGNGEESADTGDDKAGSDDGSETDDGADEDEDEDGEDGKGDDDGEGTDGDDTGGEEPDKSKPEGEGAEQQNDPRIQQLTERAEKAEREAAEARSAAQKAGVDLTSAEGVDAIPEEPEASKYEFGEHDQEYIKDHAKWEAKIEVLGEQATARFKAEAATLEAKWTKNLTGALTKYPDFDEVVVQGAKDEKWDCPPVVSLGIKDSDYGVDIAYELAKNPENATRLSQLTPLEQAREFGRMEERHHQTKERADRRAARDAERGKDNTPRRVTAAPTPPKRQVRGSGGRTSTGYDTDDFSAFEKRVDAEIKQKRG